MGYLGRGWRQDYDICNDKGLPDLQTATNQAKTYRYGEVRVRQTRLAGIARERITLPLVSLFWGQSPTRLCDSPHTLSTSFFSLLAPPVFSFFLLLAAGP